MSERINKKEIKHELVEVYEDGDVYNYMILMLIFKGKIFQSQHIILPDQIYYTRISHYRVTMILN